MLFINWNADFDTDHEISLASNLSLFYRISASSVWVNSIGLLFEHLSLCYSSLQ